MQQDFSHLLLKWFEQHGRKNLPWQKNPTPYRVWLSEIMLQQTQVKTVIPYYQKFTQNFPNIHDLAQAPLDKILHLWTGLGYYARARNLHKTAQIIAPQRQGEFPDSLDALLKLPGIGRSTAGAILSLSMGKNTPILDGNCKRIYCRYAVVEGVNSTPKVQKKLWEIAEQLTPDQHTNKFNQAMMDLGSSICLRSKPKCELCPIQQLCLARQNNTIPLYPQKKQSIALPKKSATFLVLRNQNNEVYLQQRPPAGLWGGLWCLPQFDAQEQMWDWLENNQCQYKISQYWPEQLHTFTHFKLSYTPIEVKLIQQPMKIADTQQNLWYKNDKSLQVGLPTPIKNILEQLSY